MSNTRTLNGLPHPADVPQLVDDMLSGKWQNPIYQLFKEQSEAAGYDVVEYNGRYFYHGPAVMVNDNDAFQEFLQNIKTQIKLQWDDLGKSGKIIYPR